MSTDVITSYNHVKIVQSGWYNADPDTADNWIWFGKEEQSYDDHESDIVDDYGKLFGKHLYTEQQKTLNRIAGFEIDDVEYEYDFQEQSFTVSIEVSSLLDDEEVEEEHLLNLADTVVKAMNENDHAYDFQQACFDWWLDNGVCSEANDAVERMLENNIVETYNEQWKFDTLQRVDNPTQEQIQKTIDTQFCYNCSDEDDARNVKEYVKQRWGFEPTIKSREAA